LFAKGIDELKKVVIKDTMDHMQQKTQATQKRRKVDDPVQVYADSTQDDQGSNKFDADLNHPPPPDNIEPTIDRTEDAAGSFKDPPISTKPGFNLGERPKSMYEKSARKLQKKKAPRLCGLCRQAGHTRPFCPDRDKVNMKILLSRKNKFY
jgi:hypothetical protein